MTRPAIIYCTASPNEHIINKNAEGFPLSHSDNPARLIAATIYPAPIVDDFPNRDMQAVWRDVACSVQGNQQQSVIE
jgi:hypothetical protein